MCVITQICVRKAVPTSKATFVLQHAWKERGWAEALVVNCHKPLDDTKTALSGQRTAIAQRETNVFLEFPKRHDGDSSILFYLFCNFFEWSFIFVFDQFHHDIQK